MWKWTGGYCYTSKYAIWRCKLLQRGLRWRKVFAFSNSGITGGRAGGRVPPETSDWEISADLPGKKMQGKRGKGVKIEKKRRKIVKGKVENWKWKVEKLQNEERTFFFFFFFFFCFSLFKTTKISFGSTKMDIFYRENAFHAVKKIRKNEFAPSEKFFCYAPVFQQGKIKWAFLSMLVIISIQIGQMRYVNEVKQYHLFIFKNWEIKRIWLRKKNQHMRW